MFHVEIQKIDLMNPAEKLKSIITGIKNAHLKDPEIEKMAEGRAVICSECEFADPNHPFKFFVPAEKALKEINGLGCGKCHCLIQAKVRSPLEKCPKGKW